jgi:hypothetical protein
MMNGVRFDGGAVVGEMRRLDDIPQAIATDRKAVYMAPIWAAPEAKK